MVRPAADAQYSPALPFLLAIAVYNDLETVRQLPHNELLKQAVASADVIASGGDWLLREERPGLRGGKAAREEFHSVWRSTVRGLAVAALQPGGIRFLGQHFCADHSTCGAA